MCNTWDDWNADIIYNSETFYLNVIRENYFGGNYTTGAIKSVNSFKLPMSENRTIFEFRASIANVTGQIPHIYLIPGHQIDLGQRNFVISIMKFISGRLSRDLIDDKRPDITGKRSIDFNETELEPSDFNTYELEFMENEFIWRINNQKYFRKCAKHYFESYSKFTNILKRPFFA